MTYQPHEYQCIQAWGQRMGSFAYYIRAQQAQAAKDRAPITATYRRQDGTWAVAEDIVDPMVRKAILGVRYIEEEHGQYRTDLDVTEDKWDRLPRVCAARKPSDGMPVLIHRGIEGYNKLPADFDVERFNDQRRITEAQVDAMLTGSMFGWHTQGCDPLTYSDPLAVDDDAEEE